MVRLGSDMTGSELWPPGNIEEQITPSDPCNTDVSTSAMFAPVSG